MFTSGSWRAGQRPYDFNRKLARVTGSLAGDVAADKLFVRQTCHTADPITAVAPLIKRWLEAPTAARECGPFSKSRAVDALISATSHHRRIGLDRGEVGRVPQV